MALPHITHTHQDDIVILGPVGEFDISNVDMLRSTFLEAVSPEANKIIIDLAGTEFVDSMAIGAMLGIARRANGWGGWVRLVAPRPNIRHVLAATGLDKVFGLYDTIEQAASHVEDLAAPEPA